MICSRHGCALVVLLLVSSVNGFTTVGGRFQKSSPSLVVRPSPPVGRSHPFPQTLQLTSSSEEKEGIFFNVSPLYGGLWASFLAYGLFLSPGSVGDPADTALLQAYIDNPAAPMGINPIFLIIFNGLGVMPLVVSQLACPQGSKEGPPAAPFLGGALAMGYGAAGLYLALRSPPVDRKAQSETSWFTRYVLENKITSVVSLGLLASGVLSALPRIDETGVSAALSDFVTLVGQSKFVSVSSLDLTILTIAAATLIPRDLQLRSPNEDTTKIGQQIATVSLFFPILGAALYCLWRPSLPAD